MIDLRLSIGACLLAACGGGTPTAGGVDTPGEQAGTQPEQEWSEAELDTQTAEPADPCASGTCTRCGEGVCLAGYYCEESVSACSWVPECVQAPSCGCLAKYLSGCSCEERGGGVYVTCDG
jgi:hypothetical protein